jgi:hypothetical protein
MERDDRAEKAPLNPMQSVARAVAGFGMLGLADVTWRIWPLSLLLGWLGLSHLVAAATRYNGCPELGAIPSLLRGRRVDTGCGPWRWLDRKLGLS